MPNIGKFPSTFYNPRDIERALQDGELSAKVRADYSRLRRIANDRLSRFSGTEWETSKQYKMNAGKFKRLDEIESAKELAHLLTQVQQFTSAKTSTVTGLKQQRAAAVEVLRERGYTFINKKNIRAFGEFMEEARIKKLASLYDSERLAELFATAERKKADPQKVLEQFERFQLEQNRLPPEQRKNVNRMTSAELWEGLTNEDLYREGLPSKSRKKRRNS